MILGDRHALAGQRGFGRLQRGRFDEAPVRRNGVAFLDQHDVAGNDVRGGNAPAFAVRMTVASAADIARSAATAASARDSWMYPIAALSRTTAKIAMAS